MEYLLEIINHLVYSVDHFLIMWANQLDLKWQSINRLDYKHWQILIAKITSNTNKMYKKLLSDDILWQFRKNKPIFKTLDKNRAILAILYKSYDNSDDKCQYPIEVKYPVINKIEDITLRKNREFITKSILNGASDIKTVNAELIKNLYNMYNIFFFNYCLPNIDFIVSNKMTKMAGYCKCLTVNNKTSYSITISKKIFENLTFTDDNYIIESDVKCKTRLLALQFTIEHEIIHLIMSQYNLVKNGKDKIYSAHGLLFKQLLWAYFRQSNIKHNLFNKLSDDLQKLQPTELKISSLVTFMIKNESVAGLIVKINRTRAVVRTERGTFIVDFQYLFKMKSSHVEYNNLLLKQSVLIKTMETALKLRKSESIKFWSNDGLRVKNGLFIEHYRGRLKVKINNKDVNIDPWQLII